MLQLTQIHAIIALNKEVDILHNKIKSCDSLKGEPSSEYFMKLAESYKQTIRELHGIIEEIRKREIIKFE